MIYDSETFIWWLQTDIGHHKFQQAGSVFHHNQPILFLPN